MRKIGNEVHAMEILLFRRRYKRGFSLTTLLLLLLFLSSGISGTGAVAYASDTDIRASASVNTDRLSVGDRFILTLELKGEGLQQADRPELPPIDGVEILSRVPTSTTSLSVINGAAVNTRGFRFTLEAAEAGQITIPAVELRSGGSTYTTNPLTLDVQPAGQQSASNPRGDNIYVRLELSNEQPYVGEQVIAEIVLYFHSDISVLSYQPASAWRTEGFWMERLAEEGGPRAESIMKNGIPFRRAVLMRYALFPTRSGSLQLGEYELRTNVRASRRFGDTRRFFGENRRRALDISSDSRELRVQALPEPRPEGFTGAVGRFTVDRVVPEPKVIVGEPLEVETRFEGSGNIKLINKPEYEVPSRFEAFRPSENTQTQRSVSGISGTKTFGDVLIARRVGTSELPAYRVHWFDPSAARYRFADLPAIELEILRDTEEAFSYVEDGGIRIGLASGPVRWQEAGAGQPQTGALYLRWWFWLLAAFPLIVLAAGFARRSYLNRLSTDRAFARREHAEARAQAHLKRGEDLAEAKNFRTAYAELHKAVYGFIADQFALPEAGCSDADLIDTLRAHKADEALLAAATQLFNRIKSISYAPGDSSSYFYTDRQTAEELLKRIKKLR